MTRIPILGAQSLWWTARRALLLPLLALLLVAPALAQQPGKPRVPPGRDPGTSAVAVAIVGGGIDYTRPEIKDRLARDGEGEMIGWDFEDGSTRPFARAPGPDTTMARIVLGEAGASKLVAVRVRAGDPMSYPNAVAFTVRTPARVLLTALGSSKREDWEAFRQAASHFKDLLIVVAAGSEGRDLDREPRWPASFGLDNVLVVTSCDEVGRLAAGADWGARTVDVALPAGPVAAIAGDGAAAVPSSGPASAAARVGALAARLLAVEPQLRGAALKARILSFARPAPAEPAPRTRAGWIADPARPARLE